MKTCKTCGKSLPPRRRRYCSDECARVGRRSRRQLRRFFKEHAITPEVGFARPYVRYTADDPSPVQKVYAELPQPGQKGTMTRFAKRADGVIINRHAPTGLGLDHIFPELRPDQPIKTKPLHWHCHPTVSTKDIPVIPTGPSAGRPLSKRQIHTAKAMEKHIARNKYADDHAGVTNEDVHCHQDLAKYLFPPAPKIEVPWYHDHDEAYAGRPEKRADHVERWHGGVDVVGRHAHTRKRKDASVNYAKRIDVHPFVLPMFEKAERVFFCIEGCIKADAVLSAGEAVFSVPSVTLWEAPEDELQEFAAVYLHGKTVIIVPDSDWHENGAVLTQAMLVRSALRRMSVRAIVAAPPNLDSPDPKKRKQGVDDFLVAGVAWTTF